MTVQSNRILSALRRSDFSAFVMKVFETLHPGAPPLNRAWYLHAMCHALEEASSGEQRRLVITVPPRHLKSITASVALVAWLLGHDPTRKIMVATYSQDLARDHSNLTRTIMESDWYKSDFPGTRISDRGNRALELQTTAGGVRKAVSVGGSITGFGADIIIIDDCMKSDEARSPQVREELRNWFDNTLSTRLNDITTGVIISIQQRLHEADLPAYLLDKGYNHLNLPAIAEKEELVAIAPGRHHHRLVGDLLNPLRQSRAELEQLRRDHGPAVFAAQFQQDPVAPEGNMVQMAHFGTYDELPERHEFLKVIQSWDTGISADPNSDYSVCLTAGFERHSMKWHVIDILRERLDFPDLKRAVTRLQRIWSADKVLIEDAGSGKSLWQELRASATFLPVMMRPATSKEERLIGCLAEIEAGQFLLPVDAAWLDEFRKELKAFPSGKHDDQVDSLSQLIGYQLRNWRWVMTERGLDGRALRINRNKKRPW